MPACSPRFSWASSITWPTYSFGVRIDALMYGSRTSAVRARAGVSPRAWGSRAAHLGDPGRVGRVARRVDLELLAVRQRDLEADGRHRREQVEVVLALEALAHDVHVQQPEEADAEAEAEHVAGLGLPGQCRVVERELLERVAEVRVVVRVDREDAAEDHRLDLAVAGQRLGGLAGLRRERVADAQLRDVLYAGDEEADLARVQLVRGRHRGREEADVVDVGLGAGRHRADRLALPEDAVHDPDVGDHAAVLVELGVEDQRARLRVRVAVRRRDLRDELLEDVLDALAGLAGDAPDRLRRLAEELRDLLRDALGLGAG